MQKRITNVNKMIRSYSRLKMRFQLMRDMRLMHVTLFI